MFFAVQRRKPAYMSALSYQRRPLVSVSLLLIGLLALVLPGGLVVSGTLQDISRGSGMTLLSTSATQAQEVRLPAHVRSQATHMLTASARLVRVGYGEREQYYTAYQWNVWSDSSCSGIAMEVVMNAYGRHLIAADVLQKELDLGVWSIDLGLLREEGMAMTASSFGFDTAASHTRSLQDVIASANSGKPVIVSLRDSRYYPMGHFFVIRGGDEQYVYITDSSFFNFQRMTHSMFRNMWQGFSTILTPRA